MIYVDKTEPFVKKLIKKGYSKQGIFKQLRKKLPLVGDDILKNLISFCYDKEKQ